MITKEQFFNGLVRYADEEIMPALPTSGKWIAGSVIVLITPKYESLIDELLANPIVKALGVVNTEGLINAAAMLNALEKSASKYGALELSVPLIGTLRFKTDDICKLKRYMIGD